jgi:hypothetical protein
MSVKFKKKIGDDLKPLFNFKEAHEVDEDTPPE